MRPREKKSFQREGLFQFTHPGGVRHPLPNDKNEALEFQFTHPGGVRLLDEWVVHTQVKFQFTHPGGVRLDRRGAGMYKGEFQFTHPGGVRPQGWVATAPASAFQFTHPGGVRLAAHEVLRECSRVSIHAPGRGATHYDLPYPAERYGFNSRTREGCDNQLLILNGVRDGFQFTHPGGVRPYPPPY